MVLLNWKGFHKSAVSILGLLFMSLQVFAQNTTSKLDDFNRSNNLLVGIPSGGSSLPWQEYETTGSNDYRVRIENNMLVMGSFNNIGYGASGLEQAVYDVSNRYATIYNQASAELIWAFNFRQNRSGTSGFGSTTYGIAYVLGCNKAVFTDPDASGYAVIIGNANSPDPVKLVRFKNGLNANSNITTLASSAEITETAYYSVKVSFDPCTKSWSLLVRNDNSAFADPLTVTGAAVTLADQTYTNLNLNYTGAAYNHGTVNVLAYFDNIYVPAAPALTVLNYTWSGANSTDFTDPNNWSPTRNCVRTIDALNFNNGGNISLSNVSTQEIGQLLVTNKTALTLKATTGATQTLNLAGSTGADLQVETGSSLIIDSNDPVEISLKTGATASISGTMVFQNTTANLGRAHRFLATDANAITFENGSQFIAKNLSGEPFGNTGTANIAVFKANATYISKDGASPFGLASPNSKLIFETGSLYKHEQTGTAPKFDGRIYGDFELNVAGNLAIIFGTSSPTPTRIDNFTITSGNMNVSLASGSSPLPLHIKGNLTVANGASLNYLPAAATNSSLLTFNGTTRQQLSGNINLGTYANLEINNPAGILLKSSLTVNGNLYFNQGNLVIDPAANLVFADNATTTGASNASFVVGKVYKTGDDAFTFPVGKNGFYAPIAISAPLNTSDQFVAEYFQSNPKTLFGNSVTDSLVKVSDSEYWDLERTSGTSEVKVTLSYSADRSSYIANPLDLRIAHFKNNSTWVNAGMVNTGSTPDYTLYATRNQQTSYSPFTFGSISANDPLPVELLSFSARPEANNVKLSWQTASEWNNDRFEIEYSTNGIDFESIGTVKSAGNSNAIKRYTFMDKNRGVQLAYYRLKQVDLDGKSQYSKIVFVENRAVNAGIIIYPNPATQFIKINLPPNATMHQLQIADLVGQTVKVIPIVSSQPDCQIEISDLPAGTYYVRSDSGLLPAVKFIKLK